MMLCSEVVWFVSMEHNSEQESSSAARLRSASRGGTALERGYTTAATQLHIYPSGNLVTHGNFVRLFISQ